MKKIIAVLAILSIILSLAACNVNDQDDAEETKEIVLGDEVESVVEYVKSNNAPVIYDQDFESSIDNAMACIGNNGDGIAITGGSGSGGSGDEDSKFWDAVELAIDAGKISTSLLQRRIEVGYGRAAKIIDRMEEMGFVSAPDGNKPRKILITRDEYEEKRMMSNSEE